MLLRSHFLVHKYILVPTRAAPLVFRVILPNYTARWAAFRAPEYSESAKL